MVTYQCSNGHDIGSPREIERCPVVTKGAPCDGTLKRYGPGSRKPKQEVTA